ncbi:fluoride efflux transporter CrcB [Rudaea cellulosilytica]|uniref:fluoride efflux transporter CrcB n=1 Tax=Rudaea cellulosilytica TaxID=540746 RepID=UPI0003686D5E|nr:fluoride efflux transporter CrcB [Rudaea cellulosilytica]
MNITIPSLLAVLVGGAIGSVLRWVLGVALNPVVPNLPLGTLAVNLIGGFVIGGAIAYFDHFHNLPPEWRLFVITGLCGGFTTFSAFSGETVNLLLRQEYGWTFAIVAAHVLGSLAMTLAGVGVVRAALRT